VLLAILTERQTYKKNKKTFIFYAPKTWLFYPLQQTHYAIYINICWSAFPLFLTTGRVTLSQPFPPNRPPRPIGDRGPHFDNYRSSTGNPRYTPSHFTRFRYNAI
jgi:hypothetical protein